MKWSIAASVVAALAACGCFSNPEYAAGVAFQHVSPNNADLATATQVDVAGRVGFDSWSLDLSYGSRVVDYSNDDGGTFAGEIEFKPLGVTWRHLFGAPDARVRMAAGLGVAVLTGATTRIAGVTGVDAGSLTKFVAGIDYAPVDHFLASFELAYEFNATDMTLEKPAYNGVDLDGVAVRLTALYVF